MRDELVQRGFEIVNRIEQLLSAVTMRIEQDWGLNVGYGLGEDVGY